MFDSLSTRLEGVIKKIRGKGRLTEADVDEVLKEIRTALLEADVNVGVVRNVVARIREQTIGLALSQALDPGQQVVKVVNQELTAMLGGETLKITYASRPPTVVLLAGLQGSGKTTNSAKLARWFKSQGRQPLLVGADLQRPAAVEQLRTLGRQIDVPVFSEPGDPVTTATRGLAEARRLGKDVLIVDTAGRLSIDAEMMEQVRQISANIEPDYTFLVIDAMTGQDAVGVAEAFHATLAIDGVIMSKLDGDARGGAALSVKEVIGRPIAFASTGEKLTEFEQFHPDRMAGRILGMGDMLTLIEQAEQAFEKDQAEAAAEKLLEGEFTLDDFLEQMQQLKKMGPLGNILGMMPGMPKELKGAQIGDDELRPVEAIIRSMTAEERRKPEIINGSRRNRIALGSGTSVAQVTQLVKQFGEMQKMMKRMGGAMGMGRSGKKGKQKGGKPGKGKRGGMLGMPGMPGLPGGVGGMPNMPGMPNIPGMPGMPSGFPGSK
jgi:signal recognition particle subunit SRP54